LEKDGFDRTLNVTQTIPGARTGAFGPEQIAKYQRRFPDPDGKITPMYARGMTVRTEAPALGASRQFFDECARFPGVTRDVERYRVLSLHVRMIGNRRREWNIFHDGSLRGLVQEVMCLVTADTVGKLHHGRF
jgi:hypothetical protein